MGSFARRNGRNDDYLMNQPMAVPGSYSHPDSHEFSAAGSNSYHFPQHSFSPYGSQFGPSYGQHPTLTAGLQHMQYAPDHTIPSMSTSDELRLHHPPPHYVGQSRYIQSPRYVPLRDAFSDTEVEDQESSQEGSKLSEPVLPPTDGFPDVKEFDQLMQK